DLAGRRELLVAGRGGSLIAGRCRAGRQLPAALGRTTPPVDGTAGPSAADGGPAGVRGPVLDRGGPRLDTAAGVAGGCGGTGPATAGRPGWNASGGAGRRVPDRRQGSRAGARGAGLLSAAGAARGDPAA